MAISLSKFSVMMSPWVNLLSSKQVDGLCLTFVFLILKCTDSWSLLYSRHRDSTDPADFDERGTTEEDFEEGAKR